jgi:hypothetical protein
MASIGGFTMDILNLAGSGAGAMSQVVTDVSRPGTDGRAYQLMGKKPTQAAYESLKREASGTGIASTFASYRALVGTVVALVDGMGTSRQVLILDVRRIEERQAALIVGAGSGNWFLRCIWTVEQVT